MHALSSLSQTVESSQGLHSCPVVHVHYSFSSCFEQALSTIIGLYYDTFAVSSSSKLA